MYFNVKLVRKILEDYSVFKTYYRTLQCIYSIIYSTSGIGWLEKVNGKESDIFYTCFNGWLKRMFLLPNVRLAHDFITSDK